VLPVNVGVAEVERKKKISASDGGGPLLSGRGLLQ